MDKYSKYFYKSKLLKASFAEENQIKKQKTLKITNQICKVHFLRNKSTKILKMDISVHETTF